MRECRHGHVGRMIREAHDGKLRCQECRRESRRRERRACKAEYQDEDLPALVLRLMQRLVLEKFID